MHEPEDFVSCRICGEDFQRIQHTHLKKHDTTMEDYKLRFPSVPLISCSCQKRINVGLKNIKYKERLPQIEFEDYVVCQICGKKMKLFQNHHFSSKGCMEQQIRKDVQIRTIQDYRTHFPDSAMVCTKTSLRMGVWQIGRTFSESHRRNISRGNMGRVVTIETRRKISAGQEGRNKGLTFEEIYGVKKATVIKKKLSDSHMGHITSTETRKKIGNSQRGEKGYWYGKKRSKSSVEKSRVGLKGKKSWSKGLTKYDHPSIMSISIATQSTWDNRTLQEKQDFLKLMSHQPNNEEQEVFSVVKNYGFEYVGNKQYFVGDHNPDFVNKEQKVLLEYDGAGGHDSNLPWVPDDQQQRDIERNRDYISAGYRLIVISPKNIRNINFILEECFKLRRIMID